MIIVVHYFTHIRNLPGMVQGDGHRNNPRRGAGTTRGLRVFRGQTRMIGDTGEHLAPQLVTLGEGPDVIGPARAGQGLVGAGLPDFHPAQAEQGGQHLLGFDGRPVHAKQTVLACLE